MGNDRMLQWPDAKEREAKKRRISCGMRVPASKTDAIVTRIRERLGTLGFDAKIDYHSVDAEFEDEAPHDTTDVWIDVWCDATPDILETLVLKGFDMLATAAIDAEMVTRVSAKSATKIGRLPEQPENNDPSAAGVAAA